jgi:hypothetical protein
VGKRGSVATSPYRKVNPDSQHTHKSCSKWIRLKFEREDLTVFKENNESLMAVNWEDFLNNMYNLKP